MPFRIVKIKLSLFMALVKRTCYANNIIKNVGSVSGMPNDQKVWTCALCGATEQNKRTQQPKKDGCEISYCEEHRWR